MARFSDGYGAAAVTANPTLIYKFDGNREVLSLYNNGTATVYIGSGTAVTTSTGYPVVSGGECHWLGVSDCYGIVAAGTCDVRFHNVA